jgi:hypothetical protein
LAAVGWRLQLERPSPLAPSPASPPSQAGVAFYNKLIDELVANKIKIYGTLFHWDSPQQFQVRPASRHSGSRAASDRGRCCGGMLYLVRQRCQQPDTTNVVLPVLT